jgi:hypothetical protein
MQVSATGRRKGCALMTPPDGIHGTSDGPELLHSLRETDACTAACSRPGRTRELDLAQKKFDLA